MSTRSVSSKSPRQVLLRQSRAAGFSVAGSSVSEFLASPVPQMSSVPRRVSCVGLRSRVAYEYGQSPREVLVSTFRVLRRVARLKKSRRMAERRCLSPARGRGHDQENPEFAWRSLSSVVGSVLRGLAPRPHVTCVRPPAG